MKLFETPANDEKEKKRRDGFLKYAGGLRSDKMLKPS